MSSDLTWRRAVDGWRLTLQVLVDHALQPIEPLHDPDRVAFLVPLQLSLRQRHRDSNVNVGDIIRDPSDVEQAHDVGQPAQNHACGHQSFGSPGASHADVPPCSPQPASAAGGQSPSTPGAVKFGPQTAHSGRRRSLHFCGGVRFTEPVRCGSRSHASR